MSLSPSASPFRRGACPSLSSPMETGDGLLVRLRPLLPFLTPVQLAAIALAAGEHGNGLMEITARGNLQIRGLTRDSVAAFADAMALAGIDPAEGVAIETPPLSGLPAGEITNPQGLADTLRDEIVRQSARLVLAPKLAVVIDGGGRFHLQAASADVRLQAISEEGDVSWLLSLAGTAADAIPVCRLSGENAVGAVMAVLSMLHAAGPYARGRELDPASVRAVLAPMSSMTDVETPATGEVPAVPGIHRLDDGSVALGVALPFGQVTSVALLAFLAALLDTAPQAELRLAPGHGLFVARIDAVAAKVFRDAAALCGLVTRADDPAALVSVCAGRGACASGLIETRETARQVIAAAPVLFDRSVRVHVSGCAKGCAHPAPADLTIVGASPDAGQNCYGIVVNGAASAAPEAYTDETGAAGVIARIGRAVGDSQHIGESVKACLARIGKDRVLDAVRQG